MFIKHKNIENKESSATASGVMREIDPAAKRLRSARRIVLTKTPLRSFKTPVELSRRELHSIKRSASIARRTRL
jgi:hypothetical protein